MPQSTPTDVRPMRPDQAGICRRRAVAMTRGITPEHAPLPLPAEVENRRNAARRLVPLVLERMHEDRWVIECNMTSAHAELAPGLSVAIPAYRTMYQMPPEPTDSSEAMPEPTRFDVLTRVPGPSRRAIIKTRGAAQAYYEEIAAVASAQPSPREIIVAVYDSESGAVSLHRVPMASLAELKDQWLGAMQTLHNAAKEPGDLPDPEHEYDAAPCRECHYRNSCPTQQAPPEADAPELDEDAFAEAMDQFLCADTQLRELRRFERTRDQYRDTMVKMMSDNNLTEVFIHDNMGQLRVAKLCTQKRNVPDYKGLQETLPPSRYNELVPQKESKRFTVSQPK